MKNWKALFMTSVALIIVMGVTFYVQQASMSEVKYGTKDNLQTRTVQEAMKATKEGYVIFATQTAKVGKSFFLMNDSMTSTYSQKNEANKAEPITISFIVKDSTNISEIGKSQFSQFYQNIKDAKIKYLATKPKEKDVFYDYSFKAYDLEGNQLLLKEEQLQPKEQLQQNTEQTKDKK